MMSINKNNIVKYSGRYDERHKSTYDERIEKRIKQLLKKQRYLNKSDFVKFGLWKSKRQKRNYQLNDNLTVREVTRFSFSTKSDEARIKSLMILKGVSWPVASAILHFAFPDRYPILDFRVLWSLGWAVPNSYSFIFWRKYCNKIRAVSKRFGLSIRTVDKALWEYSKENQPPKIT
jgi:Arc/MetJ-type ribon-helix-helix transcriptional regulator